ncbi:hypothetical protein HGRIS_014878 [Hohenbuehelia grisea]|uniref:NmrA-like domain-containing protein n=1 Tax=Hohenbuehelia grisea TaxID=104357 RepID=A0ABR3IR35_9AGAR
MSKETEKRVVVVGVAGRAGEPIARSLIDSRRFSVAGVVRPESVGKPAIKELEGLGVSVVALDWQNAAPRVLEALFTDVETVISACHPAAIADQAKLVDAAKSAGVKRFVPSDWSAIAPRGALKLEDMKHTFHDYLFEAGLPYTLIALGTWYDGIFPPIPPYITPTAERQLIADTVYHSFGTGQVKNTLINRLNVGRLVARVIDDEDTIGKKVLVNEDEASLDEVWSIAEKYAPQLAPLRVRVSDEDVERTITEGAAASTTFDLKNVTFIKGLFNEAMRSLYISGHNSEAAARADGWIIARERYPDVPLQTAEEWAKEYYVGSRR